MRKISFKKETQYHHGDLRNTLIVEAANIIKNNGSNELSLRKLAKKCGVSSMALYRHFPNKEALVLATLQQGYEILQQQLYDIYKQGNGDVVETLKALGRGYIEFAQNYQNYFYLMYGGNSFLPKNTEDLNQYADSLFQLLKAIIKKGMNEQKIANQDLDLASFSVWSHIHGITFLLLQGKAKN